MQATHLFGLGERVHDFYLGNGTYTMWSYDNPAQYDYGASDGNQGYGVHPVYFCSNTARNRHYGVFNLNANSQQVTLSNLEDKSALKHELTGGMIDLYVFSANSYDGVIKTYQSIVGKPLLPPFWSMGWH